MLLGKEEKKGGRKEKRKKVRQRGRKEERENKKEISYSRGRNLTQTEVTFLCSHKKRDPGIILSHWMMLNCEK